MTGDPLVEDVVPEKRGGQTAISAKESAEMAATFAARELDTGVVVDVVGDASGVALVFFCRSGSFLLIKGVGDCGLEELWGWRSRSHSILAELLS